MNFSERIDSLISAMENSGLEGVLVSQPENRFFLSGFDGSAGWVLISEVKRILAVDFRYREQAEQQAGSSYEILEISGKLSEWLPNLIEQYGIASMGLEEDIISFGEYQGIHESLKRLNSPAELLPASGFLNRLRVIKDSKEILLIRQAVRATEEALGFAVNQAIYNGITEIGAAKEIEKYIRDQGGEPAFPTIVASGSNSAMPHAQPSTKVIVDGEPVLVDLGVRLNGYCGDLTRTIILGKKTDMYQNVYDTVLTAQQAAIAHARKGTPVADIDAAARKVIEDAGYGENFKHALGHGIGLAVHEKPWVSQRSDETIENGIVFTIEPGIYIPGWGGIRIEDDYTVEYGKITPLSGFEK